MKKIKLTLFTVLLCHFSYLSIAQWNELGMGFISTPQPVCIGDTFGIAKFHLKGGFLVEAIKAAPPVDDDGNGSLTTWDFGLDMTHNFGSADGPKFYWSPENLAFRVGTAKNNNWDNSISGFLSVGFGEGVANGDYSFIQGSENSAWKEYSFVQGKSNVSFGEYSFVQGLGNVSNANNSVVMGYHNIAGDPSGVPKEGCISIGSNNESTGEGSVSLGHSTRSLGFLTTTIGYGAHASGKQAISIGSSYAGGESSIVIGHTTGKNDKPMGFKEGSFVIGKGSIWNDIPNSLMIGFNNALIDKNTIPTLFVGPASPSVSEGRFGWVGIGTKTPQSELAVNGTITAKKEILVDMNAGWPDYVFEKDYKLQPLEDVEIYVNNNKHLPGVPSAGQIRAEGLDVGNISRVMLEKIEELTLHLIQLKKENDQLRKRVEVLEN